MIYNIFAYPSNFGKVSFAKCDYFGNILSASRVCFIDRFSVNVEQQNVDDTLLFGSINQSTSFKISNLKINISADFVFTLNPSGLLDPAIDLLFNLSYWSFQGTNISYKLLTAGAPGATSLTYLGQNIAESIGLSNNPQCFSFFLVNNTQSVKLNVTSVDTNSSVLQYDSITVPDECWLEIFKYADSTFTQTFPIYSEPMFRLDTSEGSFYSCLVDKLSLSFSDDYVKISAEIFATNYDRSARFNFINTTNSLPALGIYKPLHKSRIQIKNYSNNLTSDFLIPYSELQTLQYMNSMITQQFSDTPIKEFSLNISNNLEPFYGNNYTSLKRMFVKGYVSKLRKIEGSMSAYLVRGSNFSLDRFPFVSNNSINSLSVIFGSQKMNIPYTVWKPAKVELQQNNYALANFDWIAISDQRTGQPAFNLDNLVNV